MAFRLGALAVVFAAAPVWGEHVETLTRGNFDRRVNEADMIVVKFYAPWCGHCKAMAPAYEEAAGRLLQHSPAVPLAKVDGTQEPEINGRMGIKGFPTLKIFRKGTASDYGGPRDADGIVNYILKQLEDAPVGTHASSMSADSSSPLYLSKLCRDQTCGDDEFPLIDFDQGQNKCVCSKHPCWDDNGQVHSCLTPEFPHLRMLYKEDGRLECSCNKNAVYESPYISQAKCSGHTCSEDEFPLLDFVPGENRCVCKKHPCHDMNGVSHACSDPAFPMLIYREDTNPDGSVKQLCECRKGIVTKKADGEL